MSVGDHIKSASENASNLTKRVVDAVENKVDDVTEAVEGAAQAAGEKIRHVAGSDDHD
ncbi:hypothetical protein [Microbacterium sp. USTB-Y]|jgi:hypothetical protein|uniref:hypothetical protein n=1 Tax=Microbacterium sp. USTB-Y TaxID=2823692 RepID=UPI00203B4282|nr:hypothetical protein [Microbacterium sp. USTB-Y]